MHLPHDEPEGLSAAEREFVHALRSVAPAPAPLNPFDLAFRAGQRRERADATRRLRVWQGFAAAASLTLACTLLLQYSSTSAPLPPSSATLSSTSQPTNHTTALPTNNPDLASATSAPLLYVPSAASTRSLPAAPSSAIQRLLTIGINP